MKKYSTVIVVPDEGYTAGIYSAAVKIYEDLIKKGSIPLIIVSGATRDPQKMKSYGLKKFLEKFFKIIPVQKQIAWMKSRGIPAKDIIYERRSMNTRENAVKSLQKMKQLDIFPESIHLIGSVGVMRRKYLTFKKASEEAGLNVEIRAVPVVQLFPIKLLVVYLLLIPGEILRIRKYRKLGHI